MVTEYVASLKAAWDLAKAVKASTDAIEDAELKLKIAELINALADAKVSATEDAERISELERIIDSRSEMTFTGTVYYRYTEEGERDGPWCPRCFDADNLEVRLQPSYNGNWYCNNCKNGFDGRS